MDVINRLNNYLNLQTLQFLYIISLKVGDFLAHFISKLEI